MLGCKTTNRGIKDPLGVELLHLLWTYLRSVGGIVNGRRH